LVAGFGPGSTTTGWLSSATGDFSTVNGNQAQATGTNASAFGQNTLATATNASAFGQNALASGTNASAFGQGARATASGATAVGQNAAATGAGSVAIGLNATATNSVAVGQGTLASNGGTALGDFAVATQPNSVALGNLSVAGAPNTVSVGAPGFERRITNVAPGILGTDAVNLNQLNALGSQLATAIGLTADEVRRFRQEAQRGIAAVAALPNPSMPSAPGRTSWAINGAVTSESAGAVGVGLAHRLDTAIPVMLTGSVGVGFGGRSNNNNVLFASGFGTAAYPYGYDRGRSDQAKVVKVGLAGEF
jgi:trimeric autotransporter adhesin